MNTKPQIRTKALNLRITPATHTEWVRLAKREKRSLTNMLEVAMDHYLQECPPKEMRPRNPTHLS